MPLNSYENRVYQFTDEERRRFVVKFYRPQRWTDEQIQEEHHFALELEQEEIPIVPQLRLNGATLHHYQDYRFALFTSMGGRQCEVDNEEHLEWVGRFLGRIHKVGSSKPFLHRPPLSLDEYLHQPRHTLGYSHCIPAHLQRVFSRSRYFDC